MGVTATYIYVVAYPTSLYVSCHHGSSESVFPCAQVPRLQSVVRDRRANWEQSLATLRAAKGLGARVTKTSIMLGCGESADEVLEALRLLRENLASSTFPQRCCACRSCFSSSPQGFFPVCRHTGQKMECFGATVLILTRMQRWFACFWLEILSISYVIVACAGVDVVTLGQYMRPTKRHMAVAEYVTPEAFARYQQYAEGLGFSYVAAGPLVRSSYKAGEFYLKNMLRGTGAAEQELKAATG